MWMLGADGGARAGGSGEVWEGNVHEDVEVSSVSSRPGAESPLQSFTSAAPNGKLARGGARQAVLIHQQRIGWG